MIFGILLSIKLKGCRYFQTLHFEKKGWTIPHAKCHFLLGVNFLVKQIKSLNLNFTWRKWHWYLPHDVKNVGFSGWMTEFEATRISRCLRAKCSVHRRIQHWHTSSLVSSDRYALHLVTYWVWRWIVYLGFAKKGVDRKKWGLCSQNRSVNVCLEGGFSGKAIVFVGCIQSWIRYKFSD